MKYWKAKTDFDIPHNKHLGRKPKDWLIPKYSKEKYGSTIKWQTGEPKESGLLHIQHVCWNALAMLYFALKEGKDGNK